MKLNQIHNNILLDIGKKQKLDRWNKGYNFANLDNSNKPYKIEVLLEIDLNLFEKNAELTVRHNLFSKYYDDSVGFENFISEFSNFVSQPFYMLRNFNRKDNKVSEWELDKIDIRKKVIKFSDINIVVYKEAKQYLKDKHKIDDFSKVIKDLLKKQRNTTKDEIKAVDRFVYLQEKMNNLMNMVGNENVSDYGYGYEADEDKTKKIGITKEIYNKELKKIENEIKALSKKYGFFKIDEQDFKYAEIKKKPKFNEWVKENEVELKENYETENEGESFEEYCRNIYDDWVESD